jgi:hypothetical protein
VAYIQASRTTADTVTLKQLDAQLRESEQRSGVAREEQLTRLKQQFAQEASDADARRAATKEERDFAYKVIEKELANAGDVPARAAARQISPSIATPICSPWRMGWGIMVRITPLHR